MVDEQRFDTLRVEADGVRGQLILARPDRRNALSRQTLEELVVSGEGASFCAGFDLQEVRVAVRRDG